jgi:hypothetical protein
MTSSTALEFSNINADIITMASQQAIRSKVRQHVEAPQIMTETRPFDYSCFAMPPMSPSVIPNWSIAPHVASQNPVPDRFIVQNGHGPLVPPKQDHALSLAETVIAEAPPKPAHPRNIWAILDSSANNDYLSDAPVEKPAPLNIRKQARLKKSSSFGDLVDINVVRGVQEVDAPKCNKQERMAIRLSSLNKALPKVPFSVDDSGLFTPPPAPFFDKSFESQLPKIKLTANASAFDPPPAPISNRFPIELSPCSVRSKPAPLEISHARRMPDWIVHKDAAVEVIPRSRSASPPTANSSTSLTQDHRIGKLLPARMEPLVAHRVAGAARIDQPGRKGLPRPAPIKLKKGVRFENVKSPAYSNLRSPAISDLKSPGPSSRFHQPLSPPEFSPTTPQAMIVEHPTIASNFSYLESPVILDIDVKPDSSNKAGSRGRSNTHPHLAEPRARSVSLPRQKRVAIKEDTIILPASTYDETAVSVSTLNWLGAIPKPRYQVNHARTSDRNQILRCYFHRTRPSI